MKASVAEWLPTDRESAGERYRVVFLAAALPAESGRVWVRFGFSRRQPAYDSLGPLFETKGRATSGQIERLTNDLAVRGRVVFFDAVSPA